MSYIMNRHMLTLITCQRTHINHDYMSYVMNIHVVNPDLEQSCIKVFAV